MFDDLTPILWLIPALPLAASVLTAFLGPGLLRRHSHWPCILGAAGACVLSVLALIAVVQRGPEAEAFRTYYQWIDATAFADITFTLRLDGLTAVMLVTVTFVGSLIAIYSVGYMHGDPGYPRYFAEVALFLFSMTGLVLADNFFVLYAFWEGVGLCSYLLIGFWFTKPAAAAAARKAFLVTRLGDLGLFIGILVLWFGFSANLDYDQVFKHAQAGPVLTAACLLLFCGAVGKSAQFPLHVWLPDAMEGPSPVSALIHAATMVTAGVYLVARCTPLFVLAPAAQMTVASIGAFTALLAAVMALTQTDLKRVLAYSTISQLGYMFLALGSGTGALATFAVTAALFHLVTHAFFKALLFLAAGSVMHAMGNVIDMRRFSGLRHLLKTTHWTFLCGAAALAALPPLSGFWSKDEILSAAAQASGAGHPAHVLYLILLIVGLVTAALTAFYTFRAYFLTFWGPERIPPEAGHHAHESPPVMLWPMMILAVGAVGLGIVIQPYTHWLGTVLVFGTPGLTRMEPEATNYYVLLIGIAAAVGGIYLAYWLYVRKPALADELARQHAGLYEFSRNRLYLDDLYNLVVVKPMAGLASICRVVDLYLVDGLVDLAGNVPRFLGLLFRPIQNGLVQFYALAMVLGLTVFLLSLLMR